MPLTDVAPLEASTEIDAPPAQVWALVSDLRHMPRWSPQCAKTFLRGGEMKVGAKMVNVNRRGLLVWPTQGQVVDLVPEKRVAFRIKENWTVWSFDLEPTAAGGTRLTQRRDAPKGISDLSVKLTDRVLGGVDDFTAELQRGMAQTLAKIKADAER
ncbi:SRPBCC family protein [Nocardioides aurantiacus]|uniref:Polyketide cyclase/dehydrase/lipid transport protein n=1 Tax=Nocardioides aurantiacus TaxID=86796 RepID=A0A3N2D0C4_9ACTN|nr:SRPBCC family protein [Nocardioides aurantiacus]ROR92904.1 polyketide cyclase/dehydrase/lipid transport protein [Nocardioides aurantiacus]